jgi:hypothetical protein
MLLKVAHALVHGEQVLVIAQNYQMVHSLSKRLNAMFDGCLSHRPAHDIMILGDTGGTVYFASPDTLERVTKARAFTSFFSDPGELEEHELQMIAPHIRCRAEDLMRFGFPVPFEQLDFEFPLAFEDDEPVPVPKEPVSAVRRILSSR